MKTIEFKCPPGGLVSEVLMDGIAAKGIVTATLKIVCDKRPELVLECYGSAIGTTYENVTVSCVPYVPTVSA